MHSFKSNKYHSKKDFIEHWVTNILFTVVAIFAMDYFNLLKGSSFLIIVIIFSIMAIIDFNREGWRTYINEIVIDIENRKIIFYCYQPVKGSSVAERSFDELKFDITKEWNIRTWKHSPVIYFFRNKPTDFFVSALKDRFAVQTLQEMVLVLEQLSRPVVRAKSPAIKEA
jgi:hypothetical protein